MYNEYNLMFFTQFSIPLPLFEKDPVFDRTRGDRMFHIVCMGLGYEHEPDFVMNRPDGYPHYLALLIRTKCRLRSGDEIRSYPPNTFVLYDVNAPHYYAADGVPYVDDFIQFSCDPKIIHSFGIPLNEPLPIPDWTHPEYYFMTICSAFFRNFNHDTVINSLFTAMLTDYSVIPHLPQKPLPYFGELFAIRQQIGAQPQKEWRAETVADSLHISVSYFHRIYKEAFQTSLTQDVIRSRIEAAKNLLQCTGMTSEEIAVRCGYANPEHFSRQFKQYVGVSPDIWRRQKD